MKKFLGLSTAFTIAVVGASATLILLPQSQTPFVTESRVAHTDRANAHTSQPADLSAVAPPQMFELPPLPVGVHDQATQIASATQVYHRARLLNVDGNTPYLTLAEAGDTMTANRNILPDLQRQALRQLTFTGSRLSELGAFIARSGSAHITVVNRTLDADAALTIAGQDNIVDFAGAKITPGKRPPLWLIQIRNASHVAVMNANITGGANGILVDNGSHIVLENNEIHGLTQNGIVVTGGESKYVNIHSNRLYELGRAGIMLHGPVTDMLVEGNDIRHLLGHSNWHAGILLTGRRGDVATNPDAFFLPGDYWVQEEPIFKRLESPSQNVILRNIIREGLSSGIYNDGGVADLFLDNQIQHNAKEGICFDNGATANVFASNTVTGNGQRWGQPDDILRLDSVFDEGRSADGTAVAKLPGVSIDNAIFNQIYDNDINNNWGGGIKMVRTSMFNLVGDNTITDNNLGGSAKAHFFGIELGAAGADYPAIDLDFVGSSGNILVGNTIHGKHYSGIFIAPTSVQNYTFNNHIDGVEAFDVEHPS